MSSNGIARREFLVSALAFSTLNPVVLRSQPREVRRVGGAKIKYSLNAYSFNQQLRDRAMTLEELLDFCAETGFDAVDLTGYYLPGYPQIPNQAIVNRLKRRAFLLGLDISGTGVRNNFTQTDGGARAEDEEHVRRWLGVAAGLGAPNLRIFAGPPVPTGYGRSEVETWVVRSIQQCALTAENRGVMLALQNHAEFLETPAQILTILERVNSPWLALNLDIAGFRVEDAYAAIEEMAPYAIAWQIKDSLHHAGAQATTDYDRVAEIVVKSRYRGYLLIEALNAEDPRRKVQEMLNLMRSAVEKQL